MVQELTDGNFDEVVYDSGMPILVCFWAQWCRPYKILIPTMRQLAIDYNRKAIIAKLYIDSNPKATKKYNVRNIPTILFFKNGEVADRQVGAVSKSNIAQRLDYLID